MDQLRALLYACMPKSPAPQPIVYTDIRMTKPLQAEDQRQPNGLPDTDTQTSLVDSISHRLGGFKLSDILSTQHHSQDFCETRADYVNQRLRFMLAFFALAAPAWIPIDFFTLTPEHFEPMMQARLGLSLLLVMLWGLALLRPRPRSTALLTFLTFAIPSLFYVGAVIILNSGTPEQPLAGYTAMTFLIIALLGLFPSTLLFGAISITFILLCHIGLEHYLGTLTSKDSLNTLWMLLLISGSSLWIQSGQLLMLLKLYRESTRDPLTGLINRRVLMKRLESEMEIHKSCNATFSILICDLDRFKRINDDFGHLTGDRVLKKISRVMEAHLRETDIIARFGGEEFIAVLPGLNETAAVSVAERIRHAIEAASLTAMDGRTLNFSTSIGVTQFSNGDTPETLLSRADDLLYIAKDRGRNRVISSQSERQTA